MFDLAVPLTGQQEAPAPTPTVEIEQLAVAFARRVVIESALAEQVMVSTFSAVVLGTTVWVQADPKSAVVSPRGDGSPFPPVGEGMGSCILLMDEGILRALVAGALSMNAAIDAGRVIVDGDEAQTAAMYLALRTAFP